MAIRPVLFNFVMIFGMLSASANLAAVDVPKKQSEPYSTGKWLKYSDELPGAILMRETLISSRSWAHPLDHVKWIPAGKARHMREDDPVLGITIDGQALALPWWVMKNHHVANLKLQDKGILITFCEICSSGSAFLSKIENRPVEFELAGNYQGSILIRDKLTHSLWSPFMGQALTGQHKGKALQRLPLFHGLWSEWKASFPETWVSFGEPWKRKGHGHKAAPGDDSKLGANLEASIVSKTDTRLRDNELVIGIETEQESRAYKMQQVSSLGIIHDQINGQAVVILSRRGTLIAAAYIPEIAGQSLNFYYDEGGRIVDRETGSYWYVNGQSYSGKLRGSQLTYQPSGVEEWYIWSNYHVDSSIWAGPD